MPLYLVLLHIFYMVSIIVINLYVVNRLNRPLSDFTWNHTCTHLFRFKLFISETELTFIYLQMGFQGWHWCHWALIDRSAPLSIKTPQGDRMSLWQIVPVTTFIFSGGRFGNLFDDDPKQWRMYADFIGSAGRSLKRFKCSNRRSFY